MPTLSFQRLLSTLLSAILMLPGIALTDDFNFTLHRVLLGQATFTYSSREDLHKRNEMPAQHLLQISGQTRGAISLFKNYSASFQSEEMASGLRHYRVDALDEGVTETRHIVFDPSLQAPPDVIAFADRTQKAPLAVSETHDHSRIDPLHALQQILGGVIRDESCNSVHAVYDGKRRYRVTVAPINTPPSKASDKVNTAQAEEAPRTITCEVTLQTDVPGHAPGGAERLSTPKQAHQKSGRTAGFWPFKKAQQTMVIHFRNHAGTFRFDRFEINSPLGTIQGRRRSGQ